MKKIKENLNLYKRAVKELHSISPRLFLILASMSFFDTARPFPMIWFGAKIVDELTADCRLEKLVLYLVFGIVLTLIAEASLSALGGYYDKINVDVVTETEAERIEKHVLNLDYQQLETPEFKAKLLKHKEITYNNGGAFYPFVYSTRYLFMGFFRLVFSIIIVVPMVPLLFKVTGDLFWESSKLNWCVGIILLVCIGIQLIINAKINEKSTYFQDKLYVGVRKQSAYTDILENYRLGKELRIFGAHRLIHEQTDDLMNNFIFDCYKGGTDYSKKFVAAQSVGETVITGTIYLFLALKAMAGLFTVGNLVKYVGVISQLTAGISDFGAGVSMVMYQLHYATYYFDITDTPQIQHPGTLPVEKRDDNEYLLAFENVSFRYPGSEEYALRNFSATFKVGERLAVVGRNGSGKTTMIKLLCRLYDPQEGKITLNGIDIRKYNIEEYRTLFSVVFQDFKVFSLPLGENVASSVDVDEERADLSLKQSGLADYKDKFPKGLKTSLYQDFEKDGIDISGGEAQKIALARALYKNAPFIILDEPTAALDPIAEAELYKSFNQFVGTRTAVYISHRLSSCRFCDKILVFDGGRAVQTGTHDELIKDENGLYNALWNAQSQYYLTQKVL